MSFDLIYGRQGQSVRLPGAAELCPRAATTPASHLSLYQLTIEDGHAVRGASCGRNSLRVPERRGWRARCMARDAGACARRPGLPAYEISNHARPGAESRHNLLYWRGRDYAGVGARARTAASRSPA